MLRVDTRDPVPDDPAALRGDAVEHPPSERRNVHPAAPAHVQHGGGIVREKGKQPSDRLRIQYEVRARQIRLQSFRLRRHVGPAVAMNTQGTATQAGHRFRIFFELRDAAPVTGQEDVAPSVHPDRVPTLRRHFLQQVDAPADEPEHGQVGPPVAIGFGPVRAGQGKRRPFVDEHDVPHAAANDEMIGGGHAGHARTADDDFRPGGHGCSLRVRASGGPGCRGIADRRAHASAALGASVLGASVLMPRQRVAPTCSCLGNGRALLPGPGRLFEGVGELKDAEFVLVPSDDLQSHGQAR